MRIEPSENPIAWFGDGTEAKIMRAVPDFGTNPKGEPITLLILRPTDYFKEKNEIKKEELHHGELLTFEVPSKWIIPLNPISPENPRFFIGVDFRKKHTYFTRFLYCQKCGKDIPNVFNSLRTAEAIIKSLHHENSRLKKEIRTISETLLIGLDNKTKEDIIKGISKEINRNLINEHEGD